MPKDPKAFVARFFDGPRLRYLSLEARNFPTAQKKVQKQYPAATAIDVIRGTKKDAAAYRTGKRSWLA